jgi:hypothetical protein
MMILLCFGLALTLLLRFGPDVPLLRALRASMVEAPARRLSELERHHIIFLIALSVMMLAGGDLLVVFGPEFVALFAANLAFYIDAVAITALLSAAPVARRTTRIMRVQLRGWLAVVRPITRRALREVKTRPPASKATFDNDDEPAHFLRPLAA